MWALAFQTEPACALPRLRSSLVVPAIALVRDNAPSAIANRINRCNYFRAVRGSKLAAILIIVVFALAAAVAAGPLFAPRCIPVSGGTDVVTASLDELNPGTARFFCYRDRAGHEVRFVLARTSDGVVRAVFDACRQCYRFHKGYTVADGFLICRLCGNRYKLDQMETGMASCQPIHLETRQHGNTVEVKVAALEQGQQLF